MEIPSNCVHESPGLGASELSFLPGCAQRGLHENGAHCLANRLRRRAMTSHFSQPKWAGHPPCLFLFLKLYIYPAWGWAVQKSLSHFAAFKKVSFLTSEKYITAHSLTPFSSPSFICVKGPDPLGF